MIVLLLFALLAGLITVLSPCVLPILPILLSAGAGEGKYRPVGIMLGVVLSFSFFTLSLTALVHATGISPQWLRYIAIGLIVFLGLTMLFPALERIVTTLTRSLVNVGMRVQAGSASLGTGFMSGLVLGIALGLIWTPCAGPILATITTLVATSAISWYAVAVTVAYSIGAAVPMVAIAYGGGAVVNAVGALSGYTELIRKLFGLLMIGAAVAIALHADLWLQRWVIRYFPTINIEENAMVKKELSSLLPGGHVDIDTPAPALVGIDAWLNSPPLTLEQLRGKVVLIDFWTYSCINCVRTLPYVTGWYNSYKDNGLVVIGVHTPEFEFEKKSANVEDAIKRFQINYPVALDNEYKTWRAYHNQYWPAHYLIDQQGIIRKIHFGEGDYQGMENSIRALLGMQPVSGEVEKGMTMPTTPETYLGYQRGRNYQQEIIIKPNENAAYEYKGRLLEDQVGLRGTWNVQAEYIKAAGPNCELSLNFAARHVYLVMQSPTEQKIEVWLDDKKQSEIAVHEARMYELLAIPDDGRHILMLQVPEGAMLYVFTFG